MDSKGKINNSFFDLIALFLSFVLSFFRGFYVFSKKKYKIKNNDFFNFLDFLFRYWPSYFWKKPSFFKITSFFGDIFNFLLKNTINSIDKWKGGSV